MIRPIRTASEGWLSRHRDTHDRHPAFGTHRHPYLLDDIGALAASMQRAEKPCLLDYGCGKGVLLREMEATGWFRFVRGYDPVRVAFKARPSQRYDLVLCLDVLDQIEDEFVPALIEDVAQLTQGKALFDIITVQTAQLAHLQPRSAADWQALIGSRMRIVHSRVRIASETETAAGACPERVIILAEPHTAGTA